MKPVGVSDQWFTEKDGCVSTMKGSCTVVRDFTDFCFHSYFSLMDDLREKVSEDEKPIDLKLSRLPSCFVIGTLAVLLDVPIITALALGKSPYMLFKGWQRLLEDLIGREGPFLETEKSLKMGLAYMVSVVSLFDEYANDQLYLREGTCLPRRRQQYDLDSSTILSSNEATLASKRSKTLKTAIRQLKPVQIWDWLFRSCELNGKFLLREGLIEVSDIQECLLKGKCKKLSIRLPAWCVLQCLLQSAKSDADGLLISDEVELTNFNWPKDKVLEWFLGPLLIMKEQIKGLQLSDNEEACLGKLIMTHNSQRPEDWNDSGFPSDDNVRRAQLQAIIRRLQGIVASMSRMPTFRRRFNNLVKALYVEAIETGAMVENGGSSRLKGKINMSVHNANENNVTNEFEMV
ncbi:putative membrane protein [Acorus calamus]|uniref:Membrane protein n=1 Tax=Acorus calamus TaxID=4465 RepID=A0AAV9ETE5_ACOCL|nr:putative membrane protein [Acorus calamus]